MGYPELLIGVSMARVIGLFLVKYWEDDTMIKKIVSLILIMAMFINSIGCYASQSLKNEEYNTVSIGEKIIITMRDDTKHSIIVEDILKDNIYGRYTRRQFQGKSVVIPVENIKKIERRQASPGKTVLLFIAVAGLIYLGNELSKPYFTWGTSK